MFKKYLLEAITKALDEELANQEKLMSEIKKLLSGIEDISVTTSNKSDMGLVVRVDDKENIESARKQVRSALKGANLSLEDRLVPKYDSSIECTIAE